MTTGEAVEVLKAAGYRVNAGSSSWMVWRPPLRGGPILSDEQLIEKAEYFRASSVPQESPVPNSQDDGDRSEEGVTLNPESIS